MKKLIGKRIKSYDFDLDCFFTATVRDITERHYILEVEQDEPGIKLNTRYLYCEIHDASFMVLN